MQTVQLVNDKPLQNDWAGQAAQARLVVVVQEVVSYCEDKQVSHKVAVVPLQNELAGQEAHTLLFVEVHALLTY